MGYYQRTLPPLWIGVAIALIAFVAIGVAEEGLGVLLPSIVSTYNLTPATVTLLFVSQISGYILAAFTSSLVSSRLGLARMLLITAAVSFATSIASFGAALIPTGAGWVASWAGLEIIPMLMLPLVFIMVGLHCWLVQHSVRGK